MTLTLIEMTDCKLAWTADGLRRLYLPPGHTRTLYSVWQDEQMIFAAASYADAFMYAELLAAENDTPIVDMASGFMRLSVIGDWEELPDLSAPPPAG